VTAWLGARQCHEERTILDSKRLESCQWVLEQPSVSEWTHQKDTQVLWMHGPPGCGKSFIYSRLLDYVEASDHRPLVYFLFCAADKERTTISALFRSWTLQLINLIWMSNDYPVARERARRHLIACKNTEEARPRDVSELLLSILEAQDMPSCCLAVDAIDECVDSQEFLRLIPKIPKRFKILVTGRDPPNIGPNLAPRFRILAITPELTQQDVDNYLNDAVDSLRTLDDNPLPDDLQTQIKDRLRNSSGMFLWIRLMIEDIQSQTTLEEIMECLDKLPPTLCERYDRIMATINHQPPSHRLLARKVFFWILTARQPLTAREFCAAQAIRPAAFSPTSGILSPARRLSSSGDPRSTIQRVCGALVRPRGGAGTLYPFHATVERYLAQHARETGLTAEMAAFYQLPGVSDPDALAAAVCMRYLASDAVAALWDRVDPAAVGDAGADADTEGAEGENGFWRALVATDPQFDFLRYAVMHWFHHARHIGENDLNLMNMAADLLDGGARPNAGVVWRLFWLSDPERARSVAGGCPAGFSGLHMAAYFGLDRVVAYLLRTGSFEVAVLDGAGKSPLWWAARRGHAAVVRVLIDAGAGVEEGELDGGGGGSVLSG